MRKVECCTLRTKDINDSGREKVGNLGAVCPRNRECCINLEQQRTKKEAYFPIVDSVVYKFEETDLHN